MFHKLIIFIHRLRIVMLLAILVLSFMVIGANPVDVTKYLGAGFSSAFGISNSASVQPNSINSLALELNEKEKALNSRELQLNKQERNIEASIIAKQNKLIWALFAGIAALFLLITANFVLDVRKGKEVKLNF